MEVNSFFRWQEWNPTRASDTSERKHTSEIAIFGSLAIHHSGAPFQKGFGQVTRGHGQSVDMTIET
jgi:hypothetical protein